MRPTQQQKGERFRALHARPGAFVIPNPWDAGTARILQGLGFEASNDAPFDDKNTDSTGFCGGTAPAPRAIAAAISSTSVMNKGM